MSWEHKRKDDEAQSRRENILIRNLEGLPIRQAGSVISSEVLE